MAPAARLAGALGLLASGAAAVSARRPIEPGWKPPAEYEEPDFAQNVLAKLKGNMEAALAAKGAGAGTQTVEELQRRVQVDNAPVLDRTEGGLNEVGLAKRSAVDQSHGIRYVRSRAEADGSMHLRASIDRGCTTTDIFGDNNCTFVAGEVPHIKFTALLDRDLEAGSTVNVRFNTRIFGLAAILKMQIFDKKIRGKFKETLPEVSFGCEACGRPCVMSYWGVNTTLDMPECPIVGGHEYTLLDMPVKIPQASFLKMINSDTNVTVTLRRQDGSVLTESESRVQAGQTKDEECPPLKALLGRC